MDESAKSGVRTRKRNKSIKDSAKSVLESIPQIPIHVSEIKKLILKDNPGYSVESCLDDERLLSVLQNGSTGRNPTFFKAFGHDDVFGLKCAIPEGCSTLEVVESVPNLDSDEGDSAKSVETEVLYVRLPEGHPVITSSEPELSIEEAIEQAEVIFDDEIGVEEDVTKDLETLEVKTKDLKRSSPRISPRTNGKEDLMVESDAKIAEALSKSHHNLRPKRPLRHVQALKQQAKRRKRNTALAAGLEAGSQRVSTVKKSTFNSNGDIEIHYTPNKTLSEVHNMKDVLSSISGFSLSKLKKKIPKKTSMTTTIQFAKEGSIDLETPDSILSQVNLRSLLNKSTFLKLPPEYQYKLSLLLPQADRSGGKLNHSSLNNEFFAKACQEWKERLLRGDFTPETLMKTRADIERDKAKTDPWKVTHFEPIWGIRSDFKVEAAEEWLPRANTRSSTRKKNLKVVSEDDDEDQPLLKKVKPQEIKIPDLKDEESESEEQTIIEEPVNLLDEVDSCISEPPLRSCSIDFEDEAVSIPSPVVETPSATPPGIATPPSIATPIEPQVVNSPASVRSARGNSITFSSSRSPSPAASISSQDDSELSSKGPELKIPLSEVDLSVMQTKSTSIVKPKMKHPTAALNKTRPPKGDVNIERSMEIVKTAIEKSAKNNEPVIKPGNSMIIRPAAAAANPVRPAAMTNTAVLVTTTDGKTILHPAGQILQQVRPVAPTVTPVVPTTVNVTRVRLPTVKPNLAQPQVRQVRLIQPGQRPTVFRMPVSTATSVIDTNQFTSLVTDTNKPVTSTIVVRAISPSASPGPAASTSAATTCTRVIQIGTGNQRFMRPTLTMTQAGVAFRGQVRPPQTAVIQSSPATAITTPIIVRTSSPNTAVWPSQPLTTVQLQDLFQRPRPPPPAQLQQGVRGGIVRTILVPRSNQIQPQVNTPLPHIQLPSEPVPISPQEIEKLQQPTEVKLPQVEDKPKIMNQGTKLILIQQPNGQLLAIPAAQIGNSASTVKIPPRASSAPPTEPLGASWSHPTRPASVDAIGIQKIGSQSNSLRASPALPKSTTPSPKPPSVAATPPMPTLEPNESLSIRASIDSTASDVEKPELTSEEVNGHGAAEVDENAKPKIAVQAVENGASTSKMGVALVKKAVEKSSGKVLLKPYGVPLLPKPAERPVEAGNAMACNVKALVVCKQCGKFCHNDCISSSNVCVSCLIR